MNDSAYKLDRWIHRDLEEIQYPAEKERLKIVEPPEPLAFLPTPADPNSEPVYLRPPSPETHTAIFRAEGDNTPITSLCPWTETPRLYRRPWLYSAYVSLLPGEQDSHWKDRWSRAVMSQKLYVKYVGHETTRDLVQIQTHRASIHHYQSGGRELRV
jgi:hypothetical protein